MVNIQSQVKWHQTSYKILIGISLGWAPIQFPLVLECREIDPPNLLDYIITIKHNHIVQGQAADREIDRELYFITLKFAVFCLTIIEWYGWAVGTLLSLVCFSGHTPMTDLSLEVFITETLSLICPPFIYSRRHRWTCPRTRRNCWRTMTTKGNGTSFVTGWVKGRTKRIDIYWLEEC